MYRSTKSYETQREHIVIESLRVALGRARRAENSLASLKLVRQLERLGCRVGFSGWGTK